LNTLNNMVMVKKKQNELAGSMALYEEVKAGTAEALGTKHPDF